MSLQTDVLIIGAGALGASLAYEMSSITDINITVVDAESGPAFHSSSRNTGVVHRPFYLDPVSKKVYAKSATESYEPWREVTLKANLPWVQRGVMELALNERDIKVIEKYGKWAIQNGMDEKEFSLLDGQGIRNLESRVVATGAILSNLDSNVNYGPMVGFVMGLAENNGVRALWRTKVERIIEADSPTVVCKSADGQVNIKSRLVINVSGGGAYSISRSLGLASEYSELHFRGDYWKIKGFDGVSRNIYTVPRNPGYPFLDPHFIIRPDGETEIGPNAFLVSGPYAYTGTISEILKSIAAASEWKAISMVLDREMLKLVWNDWEMSVSRSLMLRRVRRFIPDLDNKYADARGTSGIRHSLISREGFVPEAVVLGTAGTVHVLNFNSPGATGAPAFARSLLSQLMDFYGVKGTRHNHPVWRSIIENDCDIELKINMAS
ncbi:MAG: FAD-dependent oxidoreductase [Nitrososphaerota archaeon]|nr:FAD-dependent oxidoreductase [Nitrososphaerota archaeon]